MKLTNPYTLESLIDNLDERGMLVINVLIGQQAMKLLAKDKVKDIPTSNILLPNASDFGKISLPATS